MPLRRELGVSLAAFPSDAFSEETQHTGNLNLAQQNCRLFDEGLPILAQFATKRHLKLQPIDFMNMLAQSVQLLFKSSAAAEVERVKATLHWSSANAGSLCEGEMWYQTLPPPLESTWTACKAEPGDFIVSCDNIPELKGGVYIFSLCCHVDGKCAVSVKTSLRVTAAMLVVMQKYLEHNQPALKRRKIEPGST